MSVIPPPPKKNCQPIKFTCSSFFLYNCKECKRYIILIYNLRYDIFTVFNICVVVFWVVTLQFGMWVKLKGNSVLENAMKAYGMTGQFHTLTALSLCPLSSRFCQWVPTFWSNILRPSSGRELGGRMFLDIYLQDLTTCRHNLEGCNIHLM